MAPRHCPRVAVIHEAARLTVYPVATVIFFMGLSFASTGEWFVTGGFYVPDPKLQGQPAPSTTRSAKGSIGLAGAAIRARADDRDRRSWRSPRCCAASGAALLVPLALLAAVALPF